MALSFGQSVAIVAVVAICTFITRILPFMIFGGDKEVPATVQFLGKMLPPAIMAVLIVYCLKGVTLFSFPCGLPEFISIGVVALLHIWKRNALLSIGVGTVCYMVLVQMVFV